MLWKFLGRQRPPRARAARRRPRTVGPIECLETRLAPDASYHRLALGGFAQDWSGDPIQADDDWSTVPSIIGYRGDGLAAAGADPQTILADGSKTPVVVLANQSDPAAVAAGGITEFALDQPTVALSGSKTASAPHLVLHLDATGTRNVRLSFNLRDLNLPSGTVQPFAVQYRVGTAGDFVNVPAGFVADAPKGLVTPVNITLPAETYGQAQVQVRIITADAVGDDRWVGVDSIQVTASPVSAQNLVFTLDPAQSVLTLSGGLLLAPGADPIPLTEQGPGSLTTTYSGTIATSWDLGAGTLNFNVDGTSLAAAISGIWQPLPGGAEGSAEANYGGMVVLPEPFTVTILAAIRGLEARISTGSPLSLSGSSPAYSFASTQTLTLTAGSLDFNAGVFGSGSASAAGQSGQNEAAPGTLEDLGGGFYRLTVPIHVVINVPVTGGATATLITDGALVGIAALPVADLNGDALGSDHLTAFVPGGPPVQVAPGLTVSHGTATELVGAVISLTNRPDGDAESLAIDVGETGLVASYDPATGVLTISGTASLSVYQDVLRTLTYNNASEAPNNENRLIEFVLTDGLNTSLVSTAVVTVA